jgi:hypothetical protein
MQERWDKCLRSWRKIDEKMREIQFPEFGLQNIFEISMT